MRNHVTMTDVHITPRQLNKLRLKQQGCWTPGVICMICNFELLQLHEILITVQGRLNLFNHKSNLQPFPPPSFHYDDIKWKHFPRHWPFAGNNLNIAWTPRKWPWIIITVTSEWARWRLKSPAYRLFAQPFVRAQIKENIKALRHWPLWWESTGNRWIPLTKGQ